MADKAKGFKWRGSGERTSEDIDRYTRNLGRFDRYLSDAVEEFRPKEGENCIRILPRTWDDIDTWDDGWAIKVWLHRSVGPDNSTYLCLDKMGKGVCPVCEARRTAKDSDEADALTPQPRLLAWVIDRNAESKGPQIYPMPAKKIFQEIQNRSKDRRTGEALIIEGYQDRKGALFDGYDVVFKLQKGGQYPDYTGVEIMRDPTPIHRDEKTENRWLDLINEKPLPEQLKFYEADYIEKVLFGQRSQREEGEDNGNARRPAMRRPLAREDNDTQTEERSDRGTGRSSRRFSDPEPDDSIRADIGDGTDNGAVADDPREESERLRRTGVSVSREPTGRAARPITGRSSRHAEPDPEPPFEDGNGDGVSATEAAPDPHPRRTRSVEADPPPRERSAALENAKRGVENLRGRRAR